MKNMTNSQKPPTELYYTAHSESLGWNCRDTLAKYATQHRITFYIMPMALSK